MGLTKREALNQLSGPNSISNQQSLVKKIEDGNETSEESEVEESILLEADDENITTVIKRPDIITAVSSTHCSTHHR